MVDVLNQSTFIGSLIWLIFIVDDNVNISFSYTILRQTTNAREIFCYSQRARALESGAIVLKHEISGALIYQYI